MLLAEHPWRGWEGEGTLAQEVPVVTIREAAAGLLAQEEDCRWHQEEDSGKECP